MKCRQMLGWMAQAIQSFEKYPQQNICILTLPPWGNKMSWASLNLEFKLWMLIPRPCRKEGRKGKGKEKADEEGLWVNCSGDSQSGTLWESLALLSFAVSNKIKTNILKLKTKELWYLKGWPIYFTVSFCESQSSSSKTWHETFSGRSVSSCTCWEWEPNWRWMQTQTMKFQSDNTMINSNNELWEYWWHNHSGYC